MFITTLDLPGRGGRFRAAFVTPGGKRVCIEHILANEGVSPLINLTDLCMALALYLDKGHDVTNNQLATRGYKPERVRMWFIMQVDTLGSTQGLGFDADYDLQYLVTSMDFDHETEWHAMLETLDYVCNTNPQLLAFTYDDQEDTRDPNTLH